MCHRVCFVFIPACRPTQYRCGNGECIDASGVCNNKLECSDNSDEMQCGNTFDSQNNVTKR